MEMESEALLRLGRISGAVGLKGEVRVYPYADGPTVFTQLSHVLLEGRPHPVQHVRVHKKSAILQLAGVTDRTAAESLVGSELFIDRADAPALDEDTYYVRDLLGLEVVDEAGSLIGRLVEVIPGPAQDLYKVEPLEGKPFLIPAVETFVREIDLEAGRLTVHLIEGLAEL